MKSFDIPIAEIDGKKVAKLAFEKHAIPEIEDLVLCVINIDDILKVIKLPRLMYRRENGHILAAIKIQATWKMHKTLREYERLKIMVTKVRVLQ